MTVDVAADELSSDGIFERRSHDHVDFRDRVWRETGFLATTGGCQPFVEFVEVIGAQSAQRDVTDRGVDVAVNEPRVPVRGTRSDVSAFVRRPCTGQELGNGDGPASRGRSGAAFVVEAGSGQSRLGAVMADRDPRRRSRPVSGSSPS